MLWQIYQDLQTYYLNGKMRILKFIMYLFLRYYSKGATKGIAYLSALCAVVLLIYIHFFQILIILDSVTLLPISSNDLRIEKYIKIALFFLPVFLLVRLLVKPAELERMQYTNEKLKRGGILLISYIFLSIVLLFVLMFIYSKKQ